jgi:tRNA-dihydrouridine synthase A
MNSLTMTQKPHVNTEHIISVAPMMDWTDRYFRFFLRLITKRSLLYTEMLHTNTILRGKKERFLSYSPEELPLAIQFGGDDPVSLAECARIAEDYGYTEINMNVGCPSERVQNGNFGACLMASPNLVAKCMERMQSAVNIPVTVKHRIGIDGKETYQDLYHFVKTVAEAGAKKFIVHARIAILGGLSPAENRTIPPLRYADVYNLKKDFPNLHIEINGGISSYHAIDEHLQRTDSVMIGRLAYHDPFFFSEMDSKYYGLEKQAISRKQVLESFRPYVERYCREGGKLQYILRHVMGIFHSFPNAKKFRTVLTETMYQPNYSPEKFYQLVQDMDEH